MRQRKRRHERFQRHLSIYLRVADSAAIWRPIMMLILLRGVTIDKYRELIVIVTAIAHEEMIKCSIEMMIKNLPLRSIFHARALSSSASTGAS